jgi:hypothetical protein
LAALTHPTERPPRIDWIHDGDADSRRIEALRHQLQIIHREDILKIIVVEA